MRYPVITETSAQSYKAEKFVIYAKNRIFLTQKKFP